MGAPAGAVRVVFHGTAPGGEIWETGFWMMNTGVVSQANADALAFTLVAEFNATDDSGAMRITMQQIGGATYSWTTIRVYAYPDGGTKAAFIGESVLATPVAGLHSTVLPNQCALVLTLLTGAAGRSQRGRMYLPCNALNLQTSGQAAPTDISPIAAAWAKAFTDINASTTGKIVVVSQKLVAARNVTSVRADTKIDIQRRRANKQQAVATFSDPVAP